MSYDDTQAGAKLVICTKCGKAKYATHPVVPYVCIACR